MFSSNENDLIYHLTPLMNLYFNHKLFFKSPNECQFWWQIKSFKKVDFSTRNKREQSCSRVNLKMRGNKNGDSKHAQRWNPAQSRCLKHRNTWWSPLSPDSPATALHPHSADGILEQQIWHNMKKHDGQTKTEHRGGWPLDWRCHVDLCVRLWTIIHLLLYFMNSLTDVVDFHQLSKCTVLFLKENYV